MRTLRSFLIRSFLLIVLVHALSLAPAQAQTKRESTDKAVRISFSESGSVFTLRLESPVGPQRIAGTFKKDSTGIRFSSLRSEAGMLFKLYNLQGEEIFSLKQDRQQIESSLLGGRLHHQVDLALLEAFKREGGRFNESELEQLSSSIQGDPEVAKEVLELPELSIFPRLSQLLGEQLGYSGVAYPATLPLHLLARNVDRAGIGRISPGRQVLNEKEVCTRYPEYGNDCYGMCGRGCSCWWWICGDCCWHGGCWLHDYYCRSNGSYAYYYCYFEFWTPFYAGGGCAVY